MAEVPLRIDRFEVMGELGRGGQGMVLLAYDPKLERQVAVKVLNAELVEDATALKRFHREAKATAKLRHPNVVEVFDYSPEDAALAYIVSERLEGKTLSQVLALRSQPLSPAVAAAVGHEVALALQHAHEKGVVHRDLKPDNVFWEPSGRVVLVDFGIAKAVDKGDGSGAAVDLTAASQVLGTPHYLAPEVILREGATAKSDLFALGGLLFFLVTKKEAFGEESLLGVLKRIVAGAPHSLTELRPDLPPAYVKLVMQLLAADPAARPKNAEAVADALLPLVAASGVADPRRALKNALADLQAETGVWKAPAAKKLDVTTDQRVQTVVTKLSSVAGATPVDGAQTRIATVLATTPTTAPAVTVPTKTRSTWPALLAIGMLVVAGLGYVVFLLTPKKAPPPSPVVAATPPPETPPPAAPPPDLPPPAAAEAIQKIDPVERGEPAKPAHRAPSRPSTLAKGKPEATAAAPVVGLGTLRLVALPWADIYIDGEKVGTTPGFRTRMLGAGKHRIRAENPGFSPKERDVDVKPDQTTLVDLSFE